MHVHGHGTPADLARKLKPALDLIGKGAPRPASPSPAVASSGNRDPAGLGQIVSKLDTARIAQIVGTPGEQKGGARRAWQAERYRLATVAEAAMR